MGGALESRRRQGLRIHSHPGGGGGGGVHCQVIQSPQKSHLPRVVAGGQAERCGLVGQDKVMAINRRAPTNVEEAVHIIKEAGDHLVLVIGRRESREGRNADNKRGEASNRPQTARGRSRERNNSSGSTRTISKSPSRQLLQQAMAGARSQKQRSSSSPRSQQIHISPKTQQPCEEDMQQQRSKRQVEAEDLQQQNRTSIERGEAGNRVEEEQSQLFSPSAAQLQELLQFAVESAAANDKTKPEGKSILQTDKTKSVLQTDTQLSGSVPEMRGCSNEEKAGRRSCPSPMVTTVLIEETKEMKSSSRTVSTENLSSKQTPGSPATHRASSKETKTSTKETTTLTKSTTKSTENLSTLGSLGSPKFLRADFQAKCPEVRAAVRAGSSRQENDGLTKNFGSTRSMQSVGKCNCGPFYENKVACLRDSISELGKKSEKQGQENEKLLNENNDIKGAFSFAAKQLEEQEERIHKLQKEVSSLSEELNCEKVKEKATEEKQISYVQKLEEDITSIKGRLEAEVKRRESAEENYKKSASELEVKSTQMRQQSEREALRKADYEERLEKALRELRAEYDLKMRESREELARVYKARLKEMQAKAREQKEDKVSQMVLSDTILILIWQKIREQREEKEELARRVASLEMASLEVQMMMTIIL